MDAQTRSPLLWLLSEQKILENWFEVVSHNLTRIIVKPESKSPIPCPNRPQILTLSSDQVYETLKPNSLDWADTIIT